MKQQIEINVFKTYEAICNNNTHW